MSVTEFAKRYPGALQMGCWIIGVAMGILIGMAINA